jgi:NADPH:quinone reductase
MTGTMDTHTRAARLVAHGEPLSVEKIPLSEPGPGEVVVELAFSTVNPVDRYQALGRVAPDAKIPRTLGGEASGTVGGRRVLIRGHGLGTGRDGLWADSAVVPEAALIDVPDGVELRDAAAIGVAGVTAWRCVSEIAQVRATDRVLVLGASGGVGAMIVSLARSRGARVAGQTTDPAKVDAIRAAGATEVMVGDAVALGGPATLFGPTVVFDALGGDYFGTAVGAAAPEACIVTFGTSAGESGVVPLQALYRKGISVRGYAGLLAREEDLAAAARRALAALAEGELRVPVGEVFPLGQVNSALSSLAERRGAGKIVLDLGQ